MKTDLVKRLRSKGCTDIELEAADEIEALRAALERSNRFLRFCSERLEYVYGENPNVDYLLHAREALSGSR